MFEIYLYSKYKYCYSHPMYLSQYHLYKIKHFSVIEYKGILATSYTRYRDNVSSQTSYIITVS